MKLRQRIKAIFMDNAPFSVSFIGLIFALLIAQLYLGGQLNWLNYALQDQFFRLRIAGPHPHSEIVLIGVTDQTIESLGWPLPREHYVKLLDELNQAGARAVGFNILLSTPSQQSPQTDQALLKAVERSPHLVMPFFYDYAAFKSYRPMASLTERVAALGNVSMYPGEVARFMEASLLDQEQKPRQALFPMGVELARLYQGLKPEALQIREGRLMLGDKAWLQLEEGDLFRVHYQGPPGFFTRLSLEDVLKGTSRKSLKDKLVLVGAFSPTLGDVTTSPYGDQTSTPIYGTEIQAHLAQSLLDNRPLYRVPPVIICVILVLLGVGSGLLFTRYSLLQQYLLLMGTMTLITGLIWLSFCYLSVLIDSGPFLCFFGLLALGQTALINLRSYLAINNQIAKLQEYEQKLPEVGMSRRLENILQSLFYVSQADWVAFRRFDPERRQLVLQDVKAQIVASSEDPHMPPVLAFDSLPFAYSFDLLVQTQATQVLVYPLEQLPPALRKAYCSFTQGHFLHLPVYNRNGQLFGDYELFFASQNLIDEVQLALLEDMRQAAMHSLQAYLQREDPATGLIPGVEEKIGAMVRLVTIREMESAFFSTVLESTTNPVVVCDPLGEIRFYNDNFLHILKLEQGANITSANIQELMSRVFKIMPQQWQDIWLTTLHRCQQKEVQVSTERGVYHLTLTPVFGPQSEVTGVVMILTDVTKLHRQANFDKLTGLYNRRYFDELVLNEFQRCLRNPEQPFALLMMDVDHFKNFNDTYGHQVGDQVLASFGQVLSQTVRRTDMPVRYGGEEMAVILPNTNAENAAIAAEKIRRTIAALQLFDLEGRPIRQITTSIGVAQYDPQDSSYEEILRRADEALYSGKRAGRNCIFIHQGEQGLTPYTGTRTT